MSDLPILPEINFLNTNPQEIIDMIIDGYETTANTTLAQGDPRRLFLLSLAAIIIRQSVMIDLTGKNNTLYYATGDFLDHIGAMRATTRLPASGALTTERFTISAEQNHVIGIPQGTRVTADGIIYWHTTEPAQIDIGSMYVDIPVEAMTAGASQNGLNIGAINQLVDPIPYVDDVRNITVTTGGADSEDDESYRARIYNASAAFSTAGPVEAYEFWAKSASASIIDVVATSPTPGVAEIRPLLENGVIPGQEILDKVDEALSADTIRPLCDKVEVKAPIAEEYGIRFTYFIRTVDQASQQDIDNRVKKATQDYAIWQKSKIGRDIVPDEIIRRVLQAGAKRVVIDSPVFTKLENTHIAQDTVISANYGGHEHD